jgi:Rho-binding antiterminator
MNTYQSRPYRLIACDFHDELEALATLQTLCRLRYRDKAGAEITTEGKVVDLFATEQAEFLRLNDGTAIRLDHLISVNGQPIRFTDDLAACSSV